jgi:hypothetical protein
MSQETKGKTTIETAITKQLLSLKKIYKQEFPVMG